MISHVKKHNKINKLKKFYFTNNFSALDINTSGFPPVLSTVLHVTVKENLRLLKNSPCGGVGEGTAIFLSKAKRPVKMKIPAASGLGTHKIIKK